MTTVKILLPHEHGVDVYDDAQNESGYTGCLLLSRSTEPGKPEFLIHVFPPLGTRDPFGFLLEVIHSPPRSAEVMESEITPEEPR